MGPRDFLQAQARACTVALARANERHARTAQPGADCRRTLASPGWPHAVRSDRTRDVAIPGAACEGSTWPCRRVRTTGERFPAGRVGAPLPRWQRANALAIDQPHASHLAPLVRAWMDHPGLNALCDLQGHAWDIIDDRSTTPCVFLRVDRRGDWKSMVCGYAAALRNQGHVTADLTWSDVAERLEKTAATTPIRDVSSIGIYLGRPNCPVRLTVRASLRPIMTTLPGPMSTKLWRPPSGGLST
jgi:hypothetical protein